MELVLSGKLVNEVDSIGFVVDGDHAAFRRIELRAELRLEHGSRSGGRADDSNAELGRHVLGRCEIDAWRIGARRTRFKKQRGRPAPELLFENVQHSASAHVLDKSAGCKIKQRRNL